MSFPKNRHEMRREMLICIESSLNHKNLPLKKALAAISKEFRTLAHVALNELKQSCVRECNYASGTYGNGRKQNLKNFSSLIVLVM